MKVSRREFVGTASCAAAATLCALPSLGFAAGNSAARVKDNARCTLFDLQSNCALPESFEGVRSALGALGDAHRCVTEAEFASSEFVLHQTPLSKFFARDAALLILAGAGTVRSETFGLVAELLEKGARIVWESGAAFLEPRDFAQQQGLAREYLGISIGRPLDVWSRTSLQRAISAGVVQADGANGNARKMRACGHERVPYVAYRWPREVHVRDFSSIVPVSDADGRGIAHWGAIPVAWNKCVGAGTLVFIGSPIGPALRAGDSEAHSLLHSIIVS